ncbi:MAG: hypothetical protein K6C40_14265, partial [Thermoguttaceae bacterium]|nr:hypothetical protein [Thermoguttaceae bacterium]
MIKKFLKEGVRGRNNFQNVPPAAAVNLFTGEPFFSRRVKKARAFSRKPLIIPIQSFSLDQKVFERGGPGEEQFSKCSS